MNVWTHYMLLTGSIAIAANALMAAGIVLVILRCRRVGHRKLLWIIFAHFAMQACNASVMSAGLYLHAFVPWQGIFRVLSGVAEAVMVGYVVITVPNILKTMSESQDSENVRQDATSDRTQARWQLEFAGEQIRKNQLEFIRGQSKSRPTPTA